MEKRKVLGRGLDTLLPASRSTSAPPAVPAPAAAASNANAVIEISVHRINRNPYQTRKHLGHESINELAASIKACGVLQPITVRPLADGRYELITGERRWLASERAGKETVPAIVREASNQQVMEMTIIENLQRRDLNAMEEAHAFERLSREFGLTQEQMAIRTGKDRTSIANYIRLLKLPPEVQTMIDQHQLSMGHAKALMMIDNAAGIIQMAQRIIDKDMSVRQTEDYLTPAIRLKSLEDADKPEREPDPNVVDAQRQLERALGVRVTIADRRGKGKILLEYKSLEDFDRIVDALGASTSKRSK